jgi:hypothetical protein
LLLVVLLMLWLSGGGGGERRVPPPEVEFQVEAVVEQVLSHQAAGEGVWLREDTVGAGQEGGK